MGRRERPIDPTAGRLEAFAFDPRSLRIKAGEPSSRLNHRPALITSRMTCGDGNRIDLAALVGPLHGNRRPCGLLDQTHEGYRFAHRQPCRHFLANTAGRTG